MKFDYLKQPDLRNPNKPFFSRPYIPITLLNADKKVDVLALVDSGADVSLFHSSLAEALGLDWKQGKLESFTGIEGSSIEVYFHQLEVQIKGSAQKTIMRVGFSDSKGVGAILGQEGFFENNKIKFEKYNDRLEISPRKTK